MMNHQRQPSYAERVREVARLRKEVSEGLGLPPDHQIMRHLDHLEKDWRPVLLHQVKRCIDGLRAKRESLDRLGDHIPPPGTLNGEVFLGETPSLIGPSVRVCISLRRLVLNSLVVGLIGTGKSFLAALLMAGVIAASPDTRLVLYDPNSTYVDICSDAAIWLNILWENTRLNPLCAPFGYPYAKWIPEVFDLLARGELLHTRYFLVKRALELCKAGDLPERDDGICVTPSLFNLQADLESRRCRPGTKEETYRQSGLHVLSGRLETTGAVYDVNRGMEALLTDMRVRIALDGLSPLESYRFFVNNFIHYVYRRRSLVPAADVADLHTLIVLEEAQTLIERRVDARIDFYQELLLRSRSLGIGYVLIAQDVSRIDPVVFAGCSNLFVFAQASAADKELVKRLLDLSPRESALLSKLRVGECFAKFTGHPLWPYPLILKVGRP